MKAERVINYLVENIVLYDDNIEITFKSPINKSPEKEDFLLCRKLRCIQKQIFNHSIPKMVEMIIELYV